MSQRRPMVAANWKMNGSHQLVKSMISEIKQVADLDTDIVICPPSTLLDRLALEADGTKINIGAQNVSQQSSGAFTGEVSTSLLKEAGCKFVIVGHSERRSLYGESNELVAEKVKAVVDAELMPILCVGESEDEYNQGISQEVVAKQLHAVLESAGGNCLQACTIAYEPVWAIGTGKTATPEVAQKMHCFIRGWLKERIENADAIRILYGGSVKGENSKALFAQPDIDGGLIGGASLKPDEFRVICEAAKE